MPTLKRRSFGLTCIDIFIYNCDKAMRKHLYDRNVNNNKQRHKRRKKHTPKEAENLSIRLNNKDIYS